MKEKLRIVGYILLGLAVLYAVFPVTIVSMMPVYPGAQQVEKQDNKGGYIITFVTSDSAENVRAFYEAQMTHSDFPTALNFGGPWSEATPTYYADFLGILNTSGSKYTILLDLRHYLETKDTQATLRVLPGNGYFLCMYDCNGAP